MDLKGLFADDDAVSPVIGVILMVAITVILAAVIGTFVLGLGDQVQSTSPSASLSFDFDNEDRSASSPDVLTITHDGGDGIKAGQLSMEVSGALAPDGTTGDSDGHGDDTAAVVDANAWSDVTSLSADDDVSAGASADVDNSLFNDAADNALPNDDDTDGSSQHLELDSATVRVVWTSSSGDSSATIGKWEGPDA